MPNSTQQVLHDRAFGAWIHLGQIGMMTGQCARQRRVAAPPTEKFQ